MCAAARRPTDGCEVKVFWGRLKDSGELNVSGEVKAFYRRKLSSFGILRVLFVFDGSDTPPSPLATLPSPSRRLAVVAAAAADFPAFALAMPEVLRSFLF